MDPFVKISEVYYSYGDTNALQDISVEVGKQELFGVIGPDGSGKTTLFRILATLLVPQKGKVTMEGIDVVKEFKKIRKEIGYMPGRFSLYQDLTVEENLSFFASVFRTTVEENYYLIRDIYKMLEPFKKRKAGKLSGGMKQKLALSCALIHKPKILLLDEPTTGVDAVSRREFWDMLTNLKQMGITIIVSTPYMDEAIRCDRVALIKDGIILKTDSPGKIENQFENELFAVKSNHSYELLKVLRSHNNVIDAYAFGQDIHFVLQHEKHIPLVEKELKEEQIEFHELRHQGASIEDCFIQEMKRIEK